MLSVCGCLNSRPSSLSAVPRLPAPDGDVGGGVVVVVLLCRDVIACAVICHHL